MLLHLRSLRKTFLMFTSVVFCCRNYGLVVQLVRMPPCHGGGRGFESRPDRIDKASLLSQRGFLRFSAIRKVRIRIPL